MKNIGLLGIVAGALSAAVIGFAGPAQADAPVPGSVYTAANPATVTATTATVTAVTTATTRG